MKDSEEIRMVIYAIDIGDGFRCRVRKVAKTGVFTSEYALLTLAYCPSRRAMETWIMPIPNWALTISWSDAYFKGRMKIDLSIFGLT